MSPATSSQNGDFQLEAGLLATQKEEKVPFITPEPNQVKSASSPFPSATQRKPGTMSPFKRITLIFTISLLVSLGLALARNPSLTTSCMRWGHDHHQGPSKMARTALNRRQGGSLTNVTLPAPVPSQSKDQESTSSPPPANTTPSSKETPSSPASSPVNTPTSAPATSQQAPSSKSTTPETTQVPPATTQVPPATTQVPPATSLTTSSQTEKPTTSRSPESSGTSTTRQESVSKSSSTSSSSSFSSSLPPPPPSSSSGVQVSASSSSTKTGPSTTIGSTSSSSHHDATTTAPTIASTLTSSVLPESTTVDVAPTVTSFDKTITTGRVATSIPVAHVMTTTLPNGGTMTITSTSWVAVVPTEQPTSSSQPKLQNDAAKPRGRIELVLAVGVAVVGLLLF